MKKRSRILLAGACLVVCAAGLFLAIRGSSGSAAAEDRRPADWTTRAALSESAGRPRRPWVESLVTPSAAAPSPAEPARKRPARVERPAAEETAAAGKGIERPPVASNTRPELALLTDLARAQVEPPGVVKELFERKRQGASAEQLRDFVRARFPRQPKLRQVTMRWITRTDGPRRRPEPAVARDSSRASLARPGSPR